MYEQIFDYATTEQVLFSNFEKQYGELPVKEAENVAADRIWTSIVQTLSNKLPQRKQCTERVNAFLAFSEKLRQYAEENAARIKINITPTHNGFIEMQFHELFFLETSNIISRQAFVQMFKFFSNIYIGNRDGNIVIQLFYDLKDPVT